jgi:hypothetical protein
LLTLQGLIVRFTHWALTPRAFSSRSTPHNH